ncbi:MAG: NAD-binding protein [Euryarchaeota archaeon]|nr:NAD-binding protein [Euryarchaeota archaeon]
MRILIVGGGRFTERLLIDLLKIDPENTYAEIIEKSQSRAEVLAQLSYEVHGKPLSDYYGDSYIVVHMDALSEDFIETYTIDTLSKFDVILVGTGDDMTNVRIATELVRAITQGLPEGTKRPRIMIRLSSEEFSSIVEMMGIESISLPIVSKTMILKEFFVRVLRDFLGERSKRSISEDILNNIQIIWDYFKDWKRSGLVCLSIPANLLVNYALRTRYHHPDIEENVEELTQQSTEISKTPEDGISLSHMVYHSQLSPDKVRVLGCKRNNGRIEIATSGDFRIYENDIVYLLVKIPKGLDKLFEIFTGITGLIEELEKKIGEYSGVIGKATPLVCTVKNVFSGNPQISMISPHNGMSTLRGMHYSIVNKINNELRDAHDSIILFLSKSSVEDEILLRSFGLFLRMEEKGRLATQTLRIKVKTPPYKLSPRLIFVTYDPVISDLIVFSSMRAYESPEAKKKREFILEVSSLSVLSDGASSVTHKIVGIKSLLKALNVEGYTIVEINVPTTENSLIQAYKVTRLFSKIIRRITREISKGDKSKRMDTRIETLPANLLEELPLQIQSLPKFLKKIGMERLINRFSIIAIEDEDGTIILPDGSTNIIRPQDSYSKRLYVVCEEDFVDDVTIAFSRLFNEFPWKDVFKSYISEVYETYIKKSEKEVQEAWRVLMEKLKEEEIMSWLFSEE